MNDPSISGKDLIICISATGATLHTIAQIDMWSTFCNRDLSIILQ